MYACTYTCVYMCMNMYTCICVSAYLVAGLVETAGAAKEEGASAVNELDATVPYGHGYG